MYLLFYYFTTKVAVIPPTLYSSSIAIWLRVGSSKYRSVPSKQDTITISAVSEQVKVSAKRQAVINTYRC